MIRSTSGRGRLVLGALLLLGLVVGLAGGLWAAPAADAHAVVTSSNPRDRSTVSELPPAVEITFSEPVSIALGGIEVLDAAGNRVDSGATEQTTAQSLRAPLASTDGSGTFIANYRVVSADGHAIAGAIVFGVGGSVDESRAGSASTVTDPTWETIAAIGRFLAYLGALGAAGAAFFLAFIGDGGYGTASTGRWVHRLAALAILGTVVGVVSQGALATGDGAGSILEADVLREVLSAGLGWQTALLLLGLAAVVIVPATRDIMAQVLALYGGLATAGAYVLWGHAIEAERTWIAVLANVVHASVAALWVGGLLALTVMVRARMADRAAGTDADYVEAPALATARLVIGLSTAAAVSVFLLWVTGAALAWQTVGSFDDLFDPTYNRVLLIKLAVVVVVLALAAFNRFRLIPVLVDEVEPLGVAVAASTDSDPAAPPSDGDAAPPDDPDEVVAVTTSPPGSRVWHTLVGILRLEALGLVVVLLITGFLVSLTPPSEGGGRPSGQATGQATPFTGSETLRSGRLDLTVTPARTGVNGLRLTYTGPDGQPAEIAQKATVELTLPDKNIGPISRETFKVGPGQFTLDGLTDFVVAGTWTVAVVTRTSEFDAERSEFQVPVSA